MVNRSDGVLQALCKLADSHAHLTDGQLLQQFAGQGDEAAFAALLERHSGLVYAVCRNILRHDHDAEDAFQGTFLVLARQAGKIREEKAISSWLYRVAFRVAMKARRAAERRRQQESQAAAPQEERPPTDLAWRELQAILDEELNRLPEKYRAPFVLCCLTGKSKSEAAVELGWKEGTVSSRLAHARKLLQTRLARRGVTLSALLSGLAISPPGGAAAVPLPLLIATRQSALAFVAGEVPPGMAAGLAREVLRGLNAPRLKLAVAFLAVVGLVGGAAAVVLNQSPPPAPESPPVAARPSPPAEPRPNDPALAPAARTMTVGGRVTGPDGRPVRGAQVAVVVSRHPHPRETRGTEGYAARLLGRGETDREGRYQLEVPQTTARNYRLTAIAAAPGYAPSGQMADPTTITRSDHLIPLELARGHAVKVRLVDQSGQPIRGARVHVSAMVRNKPPYLLVIQYAPEVPLPGWPEPALTDDRGCLTLPDVAPETQVCLQVHDDRYALEWLRFETGKEPPDQPITIPVSPPRVLEGRVVADDTGLPLGDATVVVETRSIEHNYLSCVSGRTDRNGQFRIRPFRGERITVSVYPPDGAPYLVSHRDHAWPDKVVRHTVNVPVPRGIPVHGTVVEKGTGRPVVGASVSHEWCMLDNPFYRAARQRNETPWPTRACRTLPDGRFTIVVPPGRGYLLVKTDEPDYVHAEITTGQLDGGKGGTPYFPDGFLRLDLLPGDRPHRCAIELTRGVKLRARVTRANGQPVVSGLVLSPTYVPEGIRLDGQTIPVQDGWFEVPGCEAGKKLTVLVYDQVRMEGAVAELMPGVEPAPVVKLAPCVAARARIEGSAAASRVSPRWLTELVLRPGPDPNTTFATDIVAGIGVFTQRIFGDVNRPLPERGEYYIPNLIPGANYALRADIPGYRPARVTFQAPPPGSKEPILLTLKPEAQVPPVTIQRLPKKKD